MKNAIKMPDVIVEVRGGNVVGVYAGNEQTSIFIIDWDNETAAEAPGLVQNWQPMPLKKMRDDTSAAVRSSR